MATAARCRGRHFAFSAKTISLLGGSKLKSETWPGYVSDILPGSSLRVCAEPYGVSLKALWFMRMRLLLDEKTRVVCGSQAATGLAGGFFSKDRVGNVGVSACSDWPRTRGGLRPRI